MPLPTLKDFMGDNGFWWEYNVADDIPDGCDITWLREMWSTPSDAEQLGDKWEFILHIPYAYPNDVRLGSWLMLGTVGDMCVFKNDFEYERHEGTLAELLDLVNGYAVDGHLTDTEEL
jgi:hypothetical protein